MAAPYCVHLDNFVNFTDVLWYFILNSHVRIGTYHSKTVQRQNFITGGFVKRFLDNATRAKILRLDVFFMIYSYNDCTYWQATDNSPCLPSPHFFHPNQVLLSAQANHFYHHFLGAQVPPALLWALSDQGDPGKKNI